MPNMMQRQARPAIAKPLYSQVREHLLERVCGGEWSNGRALPNEFVLASEFRVSIGTIRRAVEGLEEQGILVRKQGRGTFVATPDPEAIKQRYCRLRAADNAPLDLRFGLVSIVRRSAVPQESAALGLPSGGEVVEVRHRVLSKGALLGIETGVVCGSALPMSAVATIKTRDRGQHPYAAYAEAGLMIARIEEAVSAVAAEEEIAEALQIAAGTPVLRLTRMAYALGGGPLEVRNCHFLTMRFGYRYSVAESQRAA